MKSTLYAALLALLTPLGAAAFPYCAALQSADTVPKKHAKRAPFLADNAGQWIIGQDQLKNAFEVTNEASVLLRAIGAAFRAQGSTLVVLPAPPRPLFVPDPLLAEMGLSRAELDAGIGSAFSGYVAALNATGIPAVDLSSFATGPARDGFYFTRDTHWTPEGAARAVAELAQLLRPDAAPDLPPFEGRFTERGSLSDVVVEVCGTQPAPEIVPAPVYAQAAGAGALLGTTDGPRAALVGTSFSDRYQRDAYQVADAIAHMLDASVANYSLTGGGPTGAMLAFIESGALGAGGYEVVVWESPYTTPLNSVDGLRQVLGALHAATPAGPAEVAEVGDAWAELPLAFDAASFTALSIEMPGVTEGKLWAELIAEDGTRQRYRMVKSKRVPAERRSPTWRLALDGLAAPQITRVKLRLQGGARTMAEVSLLR
ncbi:MAG: hypothetical protein AAGF60_12570 [Pseudomonadota bacterium]